MRSAALVADVAAWRARCRPAIARAPARAYNPLHVARPKPHEIRAASKPSSAAAARGAAADAADAPAAGADGGDAAPAASPEAMTLADLLRLNAADVSPRLPRRFAEHASSVRTYESSAAKERADSGAKPPPADSGAARDAAWWAALPGAGADAPPPSHARAARHVGAPRPSASSGAAPSGSSALARIASFDLRPRELADLLDRWVIRQAEAKRVLAVAVCDHYNHARRCLADPSLALSEEHTKPNVLLLGSTGVGKTFLMRTLARLVGVPFVRADATKFTATGYVGRDPEDLVRDLLPAAGGDVQLAQHGIVYVDEVDKLCTHTHGAGAGAGAGGGAGGGGGGGGNIHTRDVQNNFLKLLEDTDVPLDAGAHSQQAGARRGGGSRGGSAGAAASSAPAALSTKHVLFIFSGAFSHVPGLAAPAPSSKSGAPAAGGPAPDFASVVETGALVSAGLEPELVGRLPVRVRCETLDQGALLDILKESRGSALRQFERELAGYGIKLHATDGALAEVARRAAAEGTGARGLVTVLEGVLRPFKFELPCTDLCHLELDERTVARPREVLAELLAGFEPRRRQLVAADVARCAQRCEAEQGVALLLEPCAREALVEEALASGRSARHVCTERLDELVGAAAAKAAEAADDGAEPDVPTLRVTAEMLGLGGGGGGGRDGTAPAS